MSQPSRIASRRFDEGPAFFLPFGSAGTREQRDEYQRLRVAAGAAAQRIPRGREIYRMQCRLNGHDCTVEVGQRLPGAEDTVAAIFDVGGDDCYLVYGASPSREPLVRIRKKAVYEVTEFS